MQGMQLRMLVLFPSWTAIHFCTPGLLMLLGAMGPNLKRSKDTALQRNGIWDVSEKNKKAFLFKQSLTFKKLSINNKNFWTSKIRLWFKDFIGSFLYSLKSRSLFMLKCPSRIISCNHVCSFSLHLYFKHEMNQMAHLCK